MQLLYIRGQLGSVHLTTVLLSTVPSAGQCAQEKRRGTVTIWPFAFLHLTLDPLFKKDTPTVSKIVSYQSLSMIVYFLLSCGPLVALCPLSTNNK